MGRRSWADRDMSRTGKISQRPHRHPTLGEAVRGGQGYLEMHEVESARLSAEYLLAQALDCTRGDLYLRFNEHPPEHVLARYREYLAKRAAHYPLQYLCGEVEFYSLPFHVEEGVFIPRPETELLVEWIEEILGDVTDVRFLEFGVGTGVISGSLAVRNPQWTGVAFDLSPSAVSLARENFTSLDISDRVVTFAADGFNAILPACSFDLLVANPPYISSSAICALQPEVSMYESMAAIDGGSDGTAFYPLLAEAGRRYLKSGGLLAVEIGDGQAVDVETILRYSGYGWISMRRDYNGMERMVTALRPVSGRETDG